MDGPGGFPGGYIKAAASRGDRSSGRQEERGGRGKEYKCEPEPQILINLSGECSFAYIRRHSWLAVEFCFCGGKNERLSTGSYPPIPWF